MVQQQGVQEQDLTTPNLLPLPHATRSQIYNALFNYLKNVPAPSGIAWKTFSQTVMQWDQVPPANQPALIMQRMLENFTQKMANGVTKLHFHVLIWIYFRTDGFKTSSTYPDQYIDPVKDSIAQLFQTNPPMSTRLTLGGVCYHCWIDGTIASEAGVNDNQGVLCVPISILV